ncbi:MAG: TRAP transporter small permease [Rickettsiales bacterium]
MLKRFAKLDATIAIFEKWVLAWGILLMAANSIANVFGRYLFNQSIYFSEELNQFLIVLVTFVGLGYAARQGRHIRMSAVYDQLPDRGRKALMIVICALTAAIMFLLAYYAVSYLGIVADLGKVTPALQIPLYLTYLWVPVGFTITGIQYVLAIVQNLRKDGVYISYSEIDRYETPDTPEAGL